MSFRSFANNNLIMRNERIKLMTQSVVGSSIDRPILINSPVSKCDLVGRMNWQTGGSTSITEKPKRMTKQNHATIIIEDGNST